MKFIHQKFFVAAVLSLFCLSLFPAMAEAETFSKNLPTGVVELKDFRYPVYLFTPKAYAEMKELSLLIVLPDEKEDLEKYAKVWEKTATNEKLIVLVPTLKFRDKDAPLKTDSWLLKIKKDMMARYQIKKDSIYLLGQGNRAHYAAYLGLKYPKQFAAVAMVDGSWVGSFEKSIHYSKTPRKQVPFLAVFKQDDAELAPAEEKAKELIERGYLVEFMKLSAAENFSSDSVKVEIVGWLRRQSRQWNEKIQLSQKSFKEKVSVGLENFFHIE